jgi:hypothetical protein
MKHTVTVEEDTDNTTQLLSHRLCCIDHRRTGQMGTGHKAEGWEYRDACSACLATACLPNTILL